MHFCNNLAKFLSCEFEFFVRFYFLVLFFVLLGTQLKIIDKYLFIINYLYKIYNPLQISKIKKTFFDRGLKFNKLKFKILGDLDL